MADPDMKDCCRCRGANWEDLGMHGVRRLVRGKGSCAHSTFWVLVILLSLALVVYQTLGCVVHFLTYPTITEYRIIPPSVETSPALTLCNLNQWRLSKLHEKGWLSTLMSIYSEKHNSPKSSFGVNISSTNVFTYTAQTAQDMILRCRHGSHECKHSNFSLVFTEHGLCYTFPKLGQYQLDLLLNAEEYEYCELTNQRVGIVIIVHESESSPFLGQNYLMASPGMHTHIEIQSSRVSQNDVRYAGCNDNPDYTLTGCQAACLYQLIVDRCRCTPYWSLKHQSIHFDVSTCSLHSHLKCVRKQVSELTTDSLVSICHCDTSCQYTTYTATTSVSHISRRHYHHYMTDERLYTVSSRLLQAENIRAKVYRQDINQHILAFSRSVEDFKYQVESLKRNLRQVSQNLASLMENMYKRTWFHYHVGLSGAEKLYKNGFLPQWNLVHQQFLEPLVAGSYVIIFGYDDVITRLEMTSRSEVAVRRTMYLNMDAQLDVRMELAIQGLDNFTRVYYSLVDAKPMSAYIVTPERRYDATLLPVEALRDVSSVLRNEYSAISDLLAGYMERILAMRNLLKDLYLDKNGGSLNKTAYVQLKEGFLKNVLDLKDHVQLFRIKAVERVLDSIESRSSHFRRQNDTLTTSWIRLRDEQLDGTADRLRLLHPDQYPQLVRLAEDGHLYASGSVSAKPLSELAEAGLSSGVADGLSLLTARIGQLKTDGQRAQTLWQTFHDQYLAVWRSMLEDQSLSDLYAKLNTDVRAVAQNAAASSSTSTSASKLRALFAHNKMLGKSSLEIGSLDPEQFYVLLNADLSETNMRAKRTEVGDTVGQFRRLTDVGLQLQDFDRQLTRAYVNVKRVFEQFVRRSSLNEEFIKNNIISLSIKMAASGHETITESPAYSIYHLLRDIGISLILFLGASLMTVLEIFDILISCICASVTSSKNNDKNAAAMSPSSPLPSSTRHVTFQFPTENHIGSSPTKPALKRPKMEYYPGELDIHTDLDESQTEIL